MTHDGAGVRAFVRDDGHRTRRRRGPLILVLLMFGAALLSGSVATAHAQEARATALWLDGADDMVAAGADPTADQITTARTWEAWVKTTSGTGTATIVGRHRHAVGAAPWWLHAVDGYPQISLQQASRHNQRRGSARIDDGTWHHVAAVWVPAVRLDIYVDGVLANGALTGERLGGSLTVIDSIDATETPIQLGAAEYPLDVPNFHWAGTLDDVRYSVGARYDGSFTPPPQLTADGDTVGLWSLDEGEGSSTAVSGEMIGPAALENGPLWPDGP